MKSEFDIVCLEKPVDEGLTRTEVMDLYDMLKEAEALPLDIENPNGSSAAIGFLTVAAAESLDFDYTEVKKYISVILNDVDLEHDDGCYSVHGLDLYLSR